MKLIRTSLSPPPDGGRRQQAPTEAAAAAEDEMLSTPCKRHKRSPQPSDSLGAAPVQAGLAGGSPEVSCSGCSSQAEQGEPGTPTAAAAGGGGGAAMPPPPPRAPHARRPGLVYASAPTPGGSVATPAAAEVPAPPAQLPLPQEPNCFLMPKAPVQRQLFAAAGGGAAGAAGAAGVPAQPTAAQQEATQAFLATMEDQVFLDFTAAFGAA